MKPKNAQLRSKIKIGYGIGLQVDSNGLYENSKSKKWLSGPEESERKFWDAPPTNLLSSFDM